MDLAKITAKFETQGLRGDELKKAVCMYGMAAAMLTGNIKAADHFAAQFEAI